MLKRWFESTPDTMLYNKAKIYFSILIHINMIEILKSHGIQTKTENGQLMVLEEWFDTITKENGSQWLNATNWTLKQVKQFLGY